MKPNYIIMWLTKHIEKNNYPPFHFINTIGWLVIIFADTFIVSPDLLLNNLPMLITNTMQWSCGYVISIYIRSIYTKYNYSSQSIYRIIGFILVISFLASILLYFAVHLIAIPYNYKQIDGLLEITFTLNVLANNLTRYFPLFTTWSLLYFGIKLWIDLQMIRNRAEKSDLLAQSAQLQMLRYQINPHFLFNSFSSLRALIRSDKDKAEEMLNKLSEFYRYTLITRNSTFVPLKDEIEAIKHYASIEKIRFEEKIEFDFKLPENAVDFPVPTFILHPLIENAIKYGMLTSALPLRINIVVDYGDEWLTIEVANSGKWIKNGNEQKQNGTGTGLSNLVNRLEHTFPNNYHFETKEEDGKVLSILSLRKL